MTDQTSLSFAEWLQTQLRARRMSQRQLADRSGVDHSTISRLRADDLMGEEQVHQVMRLYLAVRRPPIPADWTDADRCVALPLEAPGAG